MLKLTRIVAIALIALAVVLAVVALFVSRRAAPASAPAPITASAAQDTQSVPVVEAIARLPAGEPISAASVRVARRTAPVHGAITDLSAVVGAVPLHDVAEGSPIVQGVLAQGFSLQLRAGERALAVPVDELVGAGNRILPGDFVDVFLNLKSATNYGSANEVAQTRLLLSRLRVLSYGQQDIAAAAPPAATEDTAANDDPRAADIKGGARSSGTSGTEAPPARSAVLAVPVADANRLLLGAQQGKLFLALRNPADQGAPDLALFPQARGVLAPVRGLDAEQQQALQRPENNAYAGLDGDALAGQPGAARPAATAPSTPAPPRRSTPRSTGIEIIRGTGGTPSGSL
ncbi:Flp pilus assembly protein CpaB [Stenotrophomonas sp. 24(2023)]|uniref:Flp pilus assembly protein CpaB n=1 Tax=Stenotrophomonas sp. 24(2023) TaxID=3068324 RepID=UPI0027E1D3EC|nr:Flp pilus assembly protein CpaB [Stenotrophomonas sp. 24(2023)]WMJ69491.1 Flp pilus assembly protein CpaB [Stenotrophomonas sp. 24(2023)]